MEVDYESRKTHFLMLSKKTKAIPWTKFHREKVKDWKLYWGNEVSQWNIGLQAKIDSVRKWNSYCFVQMYYAHKIFNNNEIAWSGEIIVIYRL